MQLDADYLQFISIDYGLRAVFDILFTFFPKRPPILTIAQLVNRWPYPPIDPIENILDKVCCVGILKPNQPVKKSDKQILCRLVWAMIHTYCGQHVSFGRIENAYEYALRG